MKAFLLQTKRTLEFWLCGFAELFFTSAKGRRFSGLRPSPFAEKHLPKRGADIPVRAYSPCTGWKTRAPVLCELCGLCVNFSHAKSAKNAKVNEYVYASCSSCPSGERINRKDENGEKAYAASPNWLFLNTEAQRHRVRRERVAHFTHR